MKAHNKLVSIKEYGNLPLIAQTLQSDDVFLSELKNLLTLNISVETKSVVEDYIKNTRSLKSLGLSQLKSVNNTFSDKQEITIFSLYKSFSKERILSVFINSGFKDLKWEQVSRYFEVDLQSKDLKYVMAKDVKISDISIQTIDFNKIELFKALLSLLKENTATKKYIYIPESSNILTVEVTPLLMIKSRENEDVGYNFSWIHNHPLELVNGSNAREQGHHFNSSSTSIEYGDLLMISRLNADSIVTSPYGLTLIDPALHEKPSEKYMDKTKMVWSIPYVSEMLKLNFAIKLDAQQQYLLARSISNVLMDTVGGQHKDRNLQQLRQLLVGLKQNMPANEYSKLDTLLGMDMEQLKMNFQTFNYREINALKAGYLPIFLTWRTLQKWGLMDKPVEEAARIIQEKMKTITRDFRRPDEATHLEMLTANPYLLKMLGD
ncbi:MAG: hypothetical protein PHV30_01935 [Candidatus Margulisbacteria bacterium]|nr:hypothetical protein [Candidatus Margulisiibacteriota bacterium]